MSNRDSPGSSFIVVACEEKGPEDAVYGCRVDPRILDGIPRLVISRMEIMIVL